MTEGSSRKPARAPSSAALAKRRRRVERGERDEAAARAWFDAHRPTTHQLVLPLLRALERRGGSAKPADVYDDVATIIGVNPALRRLEQTFANGRRSNLFERQVRFARETAKHKGLIVSPERGRWNLTQDGGDMLGLVKPGVVVTIFETAAGRAWWANAEDAVGAIADDSLDLIFTSPPYPHLTDKRKYGTMDVATWLDVHTSLAAAWRAKLKDSGSVIVNLGPTYISGTPCQSPYMERFTLTLLDSLGYHLADRMYWENPCRLPPMQWVAVKRVRVRPSVEPLLWFSKTAHPKADNRNVLVDYADKDRWLGNQAAAIRPSGYDVTTRSFSKDNGGRIPGSLVTAAAAQSNDAYRRACRREGLALHPAVMPASVAEFAIRLTTDKGDVVYDPFFGSGTTGAVAERLGRRWLGSERARTFLDGARLRFGDDSQDSEIASTRRQG